jgi:hypothetical protein
MLVSGAGPLPAAEEGLLVPGDRFREGPEGGVGGAEERPFTKRRQVGGDEKFFTWRQQMDQQLGSGLGNVVKRPLTNSLLLCNN